MSRPLLLVLAVLLAASAEAAETAKKKPKKKDYDYENSKYKAYRVLTSEEPKTYRFDEQGNPIAPPEAKKKSSKKKPAVKTSSEASSEEPANCEAEQTCSYQKDAVGPTPRP